MNTAVLKIAVFATLVTMTTSSTITQTIDMVTVRLGEPINLSCDIGLTLTTTESEDLEVRWYRGSSFIPYGYIDVERSGCPAETLPCPVGITTDNRGIVKYEIGTSSITVLTLTINSSTLQDNTSFRCGILKGGSNSQTSNGISVTVYVPEATSHNPGHQTPLGTTTTESTTNSPDTTTMDRSTSSHQTSTTSTRNTASTTRPTIGGTVPTTTLITATTSGQTPSMVPTPIEPDPSPSSSTMTTVVTTTTIIAVAVSACVVVIVIIILLVIIARLVSRNSRLGDTESTLLNLTAPATDNQEMNAFRQARDTHGEHLYEGTMIRTRQQDVDSPTSQQSPPVYATPINRRKRQTACNDVPHYATPTRSQRQRDQYEDPEINAIEPGPDKAGYPSSETPWGDSPPEYTTIDPHSRPSSTVESGSLYTAVLMAGRHDQTDETAGGQGSGVACPNAEIPQSPEYAQLEPDSEPQTAGIPEHSSPPKPAPRAAGDGAVTANQDAGIPEHSSSEYATLEPDAGVIDDESGTGHQEIGNPEHSSPEYAVLNPDTNAATDDGDEEELPTDAVYAQPFQTT